VLLCQPPQTQESSDDDSDDDDNVEGMTVAELTKKYKTLKRKHDHLEDVVRRVRNKLRKLDGRVVRLEEETGDSDEN